MTAWLHIGALVTLALVALGLQASCAAPPTRGGADVAHTAGEAAYLLPWAAGRRHMCVQTGPGPFSHRDGQTHALDFAMPVGTSVLAARAGTVMEVKEDSDDGGPTAEYACDGNCVRILHADDSSALYLHLQKDGVLVETGCYVLRGQEIARSGNTGWSALPHLHIQVDRKYARGVEVDREDPDGRWCSIPFAFADVCGGRPCMWRTYASGNTPQLRCGDPVR